MNFFFRLIPFLLCTTIGLSQTVPLRNPQIQGTAGSIVSGAVLGNSGTFNGAGVFNFASGTVTLPNGQTINAPTIVGAIVFPDGVRQTFNPDATTPGVNVGSYAGNPSTKVNGDMWYNSTTNALNAYINGATVSLGAGGGGGGSTTLAGLTDVNLTSIASGDFLKYNGSEWINRTAANVRTDLGLVIGTNVQAYDATLTALAGLLTAKGVVSQTGADTFVTQPSFDVKVYGAVGDTRSVSDAVTSTATNTAGPDRTTVTSATAAFTAADTGKTAWVN